MAAGFVSGSVALLKSNFPEITGATALSILKDTARDLGEMGVDPVYGHGAIDLTAAMRPVGAVSVQLSGLLNERTSPLTGSGIIAPAGVAGAFQGALSAGVMSVTDGYDRSFLVPMGGMVGERTRGGAGPDVARFAARGSSLGVPDRAGTFLSVGAPISDRVSGMPDPARFSAGHAGLIGGDAIAFTHMGEIGSGLRFGVTGAGSTGRHTAGTGLAALSVEADIGSALFTVEAGRVSERSGLLGASFHGAFDGVSSETSYMRLNADLPMGRSGTVHLSASGGDTSATGNGLLRSAQIRSESFGVGFSRRDEATGSVFSLGVSSPVSVSGGRIGMAVPVGVGAASNGVASEQVRVESVSMGLEGVSAPIDLQIGYQVPIGSARLGLGISHRSGSEGGGTTAAIGLSLKF